MEDFKPKCKCHGHPMAWRRDRNRTKGGLWRCIIKEREYSRKYNATPRARELHRLTQRRYAQRNPEKIAKQNARAIYVGSVYAGRV